MVIMVELWIGLLVDLSSNGVTNEIQLCCRFDILEEFLYMQIIVAIIETSFIQYCQTYAWCSHKNYLYAYVFKVSD